MFVLIGIGIILLYGCLVYYIGWSGWSWMKPSVSARFKWLYISALVFLAVSFLLGQAFGGNAVFGIIGAYWLAMFSLLLLLLPAAHLVIWLLRLTSLPRHVVQKWIGTAMLAALIALIGFGSWSAYSPVVRTYAIHLPKQAGDLDNLNIVMAADMHFGLLSGPGHAKRMVEQIEALEPDIVLYPGDLIDDDLQAYVNGDIGSIIGQIEAPYGVFASLGNHDKHEVMEELIAELEKSGIQVLYDEKVIIDDAFALIGRKDKTDPDRVRVSELVAGLDADMPLIMLEHQPVEFDIAAENGIDLMVSGHTHRGQIAPAHLITGMLFENDWGHLQKGAFHSVVTSGFGFWGPPIRIGSRSEIVQIKVTFGDN